MDSRLFLIPIVLIALAIIELDNRSFLRRLLSDEDLKGYHSPFIPLIVCAVAFVVVMFLFPDYKNKYDFLKEQYDEISYFEDEYKSLKYDYDELKNKVSSAYDDSVTVKFYFQYPDEVTKDEAASYFHRIYDNLFPGEW